MGRAPPPPEPASSSDEEPAVVPQQAEIVSHPLKRVQHLFLQALLSRRTIPQLAAEAMHLDFTRICQIQTPDSFIDFLDTCKEQVDHAGIEIQSVQDEITGQFSIVLINAVNDDVAKMATNYLPQEIAYFRIIIHEIMTASDYAYSLTLAAATRLVERDEITPKLTKVSAQLLIKSFIAKGWLRLTGRGILSLTARTLAELTAYFAGEYEPEEGADPEDAVCVDCAQCLTLVTNGWKCAEAECPTRLHLHCALTRASPKCPSETCKRVWEVNRETKSPIGVPIGIAVHQRKGNPDEEESEEEEEEEEVEPVKKGRRVSTTSAQAKQKRDLAEEEAELSVSEEESPPKKRSRA